MATDSAPIRQQAHTLQEVQRLDWDCPCGDCTDNDGSTWRWKGEYRAAPDGTRTIWIVDADDPGRYYHIDLPPGVVLARVEEGGRA